MCNSSFRKWRFDIIESLEINRFQTGKLFINDKPELDSAPLLNMLPNNLPNIWTQINTRKLLEKFLCIRKTRYWRNKSQREKYYGPFFNIAVILSSVQLIDIDRRLLSRHNDISKPLQHLFSSDLPAVKVECFVMDKHAVFIVASTACYRKLVCYHPGKGRSWRLFARNSFWAASQTQTIWLRVITTSEVSPCMTI